jgi:hypothetical protein
MRRTLCTLIPITLVFVLYLFLLIPENGQRVKQLFEKPCVSFDLALVFSALCCPEGPETRKLVTQHCRAVSDPEMRSPKIAYSGQMVPLGYNAQTSAGFFRDKRQESA